jgi:hypothetical protein
MLPQRFASAIGEYGLDVLPCDSPIKVGVSRTNSDSEHRENREDDEVRPDPEPFAIIVGDSTSKEAGVSSWYWEVSR